MKAQVYPKGDDGLWRRNRGGARGAILVEVRASPLARFEPVLLGHQVFGRLSWQHVEGDVEAWAWAEAAASWWAAGLSF